MYLRYESRSVGEIGTDKAFLLLQSGIPGCVASPGTFLVVIVIAPFRLLSVSLSPDFTLRRYRAETYEVVCKLRPSHIGRRILEINYDKLLMFIGGKQ